MRSEIFHGEVDIDYILRKSTNPSDILVVSFPGAGAGIPESWGYLQTINKLNCHSLFIRDTKENRYANVLFLCENRNFTIERTVVSLIEMAKRETGATHIVVAGSSLGGRCAIYYGLKYGFDIISGGASYSVRDGYAICMTGSNAPEDLNWAKGIFKDVVRKAGEKGYCGKIYMCWGAGEPIWTDENNAPKMLKDMDEVGIKYTYQLMNYSDHFTVFRTFPQFLESKLKLLLGYSDEDEEDARTDAQKFNDEIAENDNKILNVFKNIKNIAPNKDIKKLNAYFYLPKNLKVDKDNILQVLEEFSDFSRIAEFNNEYWRTSILENKREALSFVFQKALLDIYVQSGDVRVLNLITENLRVFFESFYEPVDDINSPKFHYSSFVKNNIMRLWFMLCYACVPKEKEANYFDEAVITTEIVKCLENICITHLISTDIYLLIEKSMAVLYAAQYLRNDKELFEKLYEYTLDLIKIIIDYCFDKNGICLIRESAFYSVIYIYKLIEFINDNHFPENKKLIIIEKKYDKARSMFAMQIAPNTQLPAIGNTSYCAVNSSWIKRQTGIFINSESNIAIINTDNVHISVNSGANFHEPIKHCDLLSFQFFYDKAWLIMDSEGGADPLDDFAVSAVAHSALLCDDNDYAQPTYIDWTSINDFKEHDDYVIISMSHKLFSGVELKRTLIWLKPNVIILYDEGISEIGHKYTQNFILPDATFSGKETVSLKIDSVDLLIRQFGDDFELKDYHGTLDKNDTLENMRGSLITNSQALRKGLNLAYNQYTEKASFLTAIEAHSNENADLKKVEKSVRSLRAEDNNIVVCLSDGSEKILTF